MSKVTVPHLHSGASIVILHRPHSSVDKLVNQLSKIGLGVAVQWPELDASAYSADFIFFDADMGFDEQFSWKMGESPMPLIALIGSEAPGRIEWALEMGADAHLLKPIGDSGAYSALLIARTAFETRKALMAQARDLRERLSARQTIVQAVAILSEKLPAEEDVYDHLRRLAMSSSISIEKAAERVVKARTHTCNPDDDEREINGR